MSNFEKQYGEFRLSTEQCESLRRLADPRLHLPRTEDRVIVESVIVEDGERRVIKKEEQCAKLV